MNILRRRNAGNNVPSNETTRDELSEPDDDEDLSVQTAKHLHGLAKKNGVGSKRRTAWIFIFGGLFGVVVAAFFLGHSEIDFSILQDVGLADILPSGVMSYARELQVS